MPLVDLQPAVALRTVRIMKLCFLVFGILLIFLAFRLQAASPLKNPAMEMVMTAVALADVALGFVMPRLIMRAALARAQGGAVLPVRSWMTSCVVGLAFFSSCNLFGFALHLLGARPPFVVLLFSVGMCALLVWNPGRPPEAPNGPIEPQ